MKKEYILGEVFPVKFLVHSDKREPFRVLSASWELIRYGEVESTGDCKITIDEQGNNFLDMDLEPKDTGRYTLLITMKIGEYTRMKTVEFSVRDV